MSVHPLARAAALYADLVPSTGTESVPRATSATPVNYIQHQHAVYRANPAVRMSDIEITVPSSTPHRPLLLIRGLVPVSERTMESRHALALPQQQQQHGQSSEEVLLPRFVTATTSAHDDDEDATRRSAHAVGTVDEERQLALVPQNSDDLVALLSSPPSSWTPSQAGSSGSPPPASVRAYSLPSQPHERSSDTASVNLRDNSLLQRRASDFAKLSEAQLGGIVAGMEADAAKLVRS